MLRSSLCLRVYFLRSASHCRDDPAKWNTARRRTRHKRRPCNLPNAVAWPARVYRNMTDRGLTASRPDAKPPARNIADD